MKHRKSIDSKPILFMLSYYKYHSLLLELLKFQKNILLSSCSFFGCCVVKSLHNSNYFFSLELPQQLRRTRDKDFFLFALFVQQSNNNFFFHEKNTFKVNERFNRKFFLLFDDCIIVIKL